MSRRASTASRPRQVRTRHRRRDRSRSSCLAPAAGAELSDDAIRAAWALAVGRIPLCHPVRCRSRLHVQARTDARGRLRPASPGCPPPAARPRRRRDQKTGAGDPRAASGDTSAPFTEAGRHTEAIEHGAAPGNWRSALGARRRDRAPRPGPEASAAQRRAPRGTPRKSRCSSPWRRRRSRPPEGMASGSRANAGPASVSRRPG